MYEIPEFHQEPYTSKMGWGTQFANYKRRGGRKGDGANDSREIMRGAARGTTKACHMGEQSVGATLRPRAAHHAAFVVEGKQQDLGLEKS